MILLNKNGLPTPVLMAIQQSIDGYDRGDCEFTTTELIKSAYHCRLKKENYATLEVEADENLASMAGTALHAAIECAARKIDGAVCEQRYYAVIDGHKIGGKIDYMCGSALYDWKDTKVWESVFEPDHYKWTAQMNINRYILKQNKINTTKMIVWARYKDWMPSKAKNPDGYPGHHHEQVLIHAWNDDKTLAYIRERLADHLSEKPEPCAPWYTGEKPTLYAIMREGRKSALKLCAYETEARGRMGEYGGTYIETRPGGKFMCDGYCDCRHICPENRGA